MRLIVRTLLTLLTFLAATAHAQASDYALEHLRGGVYRFVAGNYRSLVVVAKSAVVLTDPIDATAATWLKREVERRFAKPIRFVVYSHDHSDHTYGGAELAEETTVVVSQRLARESLVLTRARTRLPDLVFDESLTLYVDDHRIHLQYHGPNNGKGSVSMRVEPEGVLYVVDWIVLGRMPYRDLIGYDIHGMIRSTREVLTRDFALFVGGHGKVGKARDVRHYLGYLEALHEAVLEGMRAGKSLTQLQTEIRLPAYATLPKYEAWLAENVAGVYRMLRDDAYLSMRPEVPAPATPEP